MKNIYINKQKSDGVQEENITRSLDKIKIGDLIYIKRYFPPKLGTPSGNMDFM